MMSSTRLWQFTESLRRHLLPLLAIAVGLASRIHGVPISLETQANVMVETAVRMRSSAHDDPFNKVSLDVVFTTPNNKTLRVPAFWAGGNKWKVRYASPIVGDHHFISECSDAKDKGLHNVTGNVRINAYKGENPFYKHGPIRVAADQRYLQHADGTPFFWLGDTWWMGLCHRLHWPDEVKTLAADRKKKGFNVIQIVAGLYPDMPPFDPRGANEAGFPWEEKYARIRPEYFDAADQRIEYLVDQGFSPCIVGAWGYFMPLMGVEKAKQHWRYLIARYGALPVVWCAAGEANLPWYLAKGFPYDDRKQVTDWTEVMRYIRATDPVSPAAHDSSDRHRPLVGPPCDGRPGAARFRHAANAAWPTRGRRADRANRATVVRRQADDAGDQRRSRLRNAERQPANAMDAANVLAVHDQRRGRTHVRRERHLAVQPPRRTARQVASRRRLRAHSLGRIDEFARLAANWDSERNCSKSSSGRNSRRTPDWATYAETDGSLKPKWAHWIWTPEGDPTTDAPAAKRYFRKTFELPPGKPPPHGMLWISADDRFIAYLNGERIASHAGTGTFASVDVSSKLKPGRNVLAVEAENLPAPVPANPAGLLANLQVQTANGKEHRDRHRHILAVRQ